jgi:hypothetical protein
VKTLALLRPAVYALLVQALGLVVAWRASHAAYPTDPSDPWMSEVAARWSLLGGLAATGLVAGAVALRGLYRLHRERGFVVAFLGTLAYVPVVAVASVATVALLMAVRLW